MTMPASRRGFVLGLAALPAAGTVAAAPSPDPHVALGEEAVVLWRRVQALKWGWGHPNGTPECDAADAAHHAFTEHCLDVAELPPPVTLPGLRALAVTMALLHEGEEDEELCRYEQCSFRFLEQVLAMTGAVMPDGFTGFLFRTHADPVDVVPHAEG